MLNIGGGGIITNIPVALMSVKNLRNTLCGVGMCLMNIVDIFDHKDARITLLLLMLMLANADVPGVCTGHDAWNYPVIRTRPRG